MGHIKGGKRKWGGIIAQCTALLTRDLLVVIFEYCKGTVGDGENIGRRGRAARSPLIAGDVERVAYCTE